MLALLAVACSGGGASDGAAPTTTTAPAVAPVIDARLSAHPVSAISAVLDVRTDAPARVSVTVSGPGGDFEIPIDDELATNYRLPVVGMRADATYTVTVTASNDGGESEQALDWQTGSLPDDLPPIRLTASDAARAQPGVTVFDAIRFAPVPLPEGEAPPDNGYVIAVDGEGQVVWYHRIPLQILDVERTARGTFLVTAGDTVIEEFDLFGEELREWGGRVATRAPGTDLAGRPLSSDRTLPIDIDSAHHEVNELPNGDILTLSTELIEIGLPDAERLCPANPGTSLVGDIVVELSPEGEVVQEWHMDDVFDPTQRPGAEICLPQQAIAPPMWFYPAANDIRDWTHANAIALDEAANTLYVSLRHLDAVVALRYKDDANGRAGELLWELGADGTLDLTSGEFMSHQHAVELLGDGELMVYDNGNTKTPPYSRAVIYRVDPEAGTAEQVWEHRDTTDDGRPMFTPFLGDVDRLANGDILITHGGASTVAGQLYGRVIEVDRASDDIVWDLTVGETSGSWALYRSERYDSLYGASFEKVA